jgi:phospholipid/cholesterol/gamma-HCH transport system ATP-binding protein
MNEDHRPSLPPSLESSKPEEAVRLQGVSKAFDGKEVLVGVDLGVKPGESMVVIGRSGEGKSVLLKHIIGLLQPDAGKVYVCGQEISRLSEDELTPIRKKVGMVFQGSALFDSLTVRENVGFFLDQEKELPPKEIDGRVVEELRRVNLEEILDKKPAELSGGMKKRVGLARTTIMQPEVILYDEPTTGLDPITADAINDLIIQMQQELRVTSVVVTHDMASAQKVGSRIALLHRGKIVFLGTAGEIPSTDDAQMRQFVEGRASGPLTEN